MKKEEEVKNKEIEAKKKKKKRKKRGKPARVYLCLHDAERGSSRGGGDASHIRVEQRPEWTRRLLQFAQLALLLGVCKLDHQARRRPLAG